MPTDKDPFITIREMEDLYTIDDALEAAIGSQEYLIEEVKTVKEMQLSPRYNRQKAEMAVKAIGDLRENIEQIAHVMVEIASEYGVPQRVVAEHMKIAPTTVLRWIRNPIGLTRDEYVETMDARLEAGLEGLAKDPRP